MADSFAPSPRVITTDLGGTALSRALRDGTAPSAWRGSPPDTAGAWRARADARASRCRGWRDVLRPAFGAGATLLDRLGDGGVVVTTGQQPGLFGGPLYTLHKALSARAMAQAHERATGIPTVPVFWAATDDADFAEAAETTIAGPRGAERLQLLAAPAADGVPLAFVPLSAEVDALRARLADASGSLADGRPLAAIGHFQSGWSIGDAYVAMLRALLEPLGIAVLDAAHAAVGDASRAFLERALQSAPAVHSALAARADEMQRFGTPVPVDVDRDLSLVFRWEGSGLAPSKRRLRLDESGSTSPERLSPNVLLRPIVESELLPTVAYVAGPGELAYFAQVSAVAGALGVAAPLALPRWSGLIVPDDVDAVLQTHGWTPETLRDPHAAEGLVARASLPPAAADALRSLRASIDREIGRLDGVLPAAAVAGARGDLTRRLDRVERRSLAATKRREVDQITAVARARGLLYPWGRPQERALNAIPLWSRYGDALLSTLHAATTLHAAQWWPEGQ